MKSLLTVLIIGFFAANGVCNQDTLTIDLNDSTKLTFIKEKFNKADHDIIYWDSTHQAITSIDNKPVYGTDATLPLYELVVAELLVNGEKIKLETTGMFDPWLDSETSVQCNLQKFLGNPMKLTCLFSIGAGAYLTEWTVVGERSYRTMITSDLKILDVVIVGE